MSPVARYRALGMALALAVFLIDQGVKYWVTGPLGINQVGDVLPLLPIFALRFTQNFGVSLGMFTASSDAQRWMLVGVTALIALVVTVWLARERKLGEIVALALILGGALGNIRDRVQLGYVVDYADLHFGTFRPFLIFNIADAAISIGVVIILARAIFLRDKPDQHTHDRPDEAPETFR
ncbi:signal peptidase II [Porphyrobacter algicida]|uniref:Lipoprotein signal peptidase n=1 Tax=Qipengyuania algicida TaxID=1836209 RepID=A0A845ALN1_9SPHN|nr:signal peptidase II [Qipengyuania algicida]MXP27928.1 signal peptidase II [Qipengyuania algicida]